MVYSVVQAKSMFVDAARRQAHVALCLALEEAEIWAGNPPRAILKQHVEPIEKH